MELGFHSFLCLRWSPYVDDLELAVQPKQALHCQSSWDDRYIFIRFLRTVILSLVRWVNALDSTQLFPALHAFFPGSLLYWVRQIEDDIEESNGRLRLWAAFEPSCPCFCLSGNLILQEKGLNLFTISWGQGMAVETTECDCIDTPLWNPPTVATVKYRCKLILFSQGK